MLVLLLLLLDSLRNAGFGDFLAAIFWEWLELVDRKAGGSDELSADGGFHRRVTAGRSSELVLELSELLSLTWLLISSLSSRKLEKERFLESSS